MNKLRTSVAQNRIIISTLIFVLMAFHASGKLEWRVITTFENLLYDLRLTLTMPMTIDPRIIIVDIDEKSIQAEGRWPWHRNKLAHLVNKLFDDYQIKVAGFDMVFAEKDDVSADLVIDELSRLPLFQRPQAQNILKNKKADWQTDLRFSESMVARDLVLGYIFKKGLYEGESPDLGALPQPVIKQQQIQNIAIKAYQAAGYTGNLIALQQAAMTAGFYDYPREEEVLRKVPMLQLFKGDLYESLALSVARVYLGSPKLQLSFDGNGNIQSSLNLDRLLIADKEIPVDETLSVYVPYRGGQGSFLYLPATDVLNGRIAKELLKDKIVLVGSSSPGLLDLRAVPFDESYIGVEVHANIISGILDQSFKQSPSYVVAVELIQLLLLALLLLWRIPLAQPSGILIVLIFVLVVTSAVNYWFWQKVDLVVPLASSFMLIFMSTFLHILYSFFVENKDKKRLSSFFGQYVPPEIVKEMDHEEAELSIAGENRLMTVLFSDVRSFTTMSEGLNPAELTQLMNEFLTPITAAIHHHKGTIDKYMGDAVMAFWGAPLSDKQHAVHSIYAAFDMINAMKTVSALFKQQGRPEIKVGIGINSGQMNVGNMGSEFRMAYTVMGDSVNLGSRLEGLTKNYGVDIIVGEETKKLAKEICYRELDKVKVKGKNKSVRIFEPVPTELAEQSTFQENLIKHHQAIMAYRARHWEQAEALFLQLQTQEEHSVYAIYLQRITRHKLFEPDPDWDGSYTFTTK